SEPDGATPKSLTVDMKDLRVVSRLRITTPDAERHAPVRGEIFGSNDGRFWFRIASNPPYAAVENVADEFGRMKARIYAGNYTNYSEWSQIVSLGRNSTPLEEQESVERLEWQRPATEEDA